MRAFVFFLVVFHLAVLLARSRKYQLFDVLDLSIICWGCYLLLS